MKTLSIHQPWAWLIVHGYKTVENRSWRTNHRGPLAIHASRTIDHDAFDNVIAQCIAAGEPLTPAELAEMSITGAVIGTVDVIDCTHEPESTDICWHNTGCLAWILRNPQPISPVPARGMPGLFDIQL